MKKERLSSSISHNGEEHSGMHAKNAYKAVKENFRTFFSLNEDFSSLFLEEKA